MDCCCIGKCQFIQFCDIILYDASVEIHFQISGCHIHRIDHPDIAVKHFFVIIIADLHHLIALPQRAAHQGGFAFAALAAIIGTAFGAGFYAGGIICYAFIFLAMQVLRRVDLRIRKTQRVSTVYFEMEKKSTVGQIIRQVKGHGHYIWDLNLFSETQEKSGGPVCGTFTLWVNGKTTLDEEIQALEALDGVSYMTLM